VRAVAFFRGINVGTAKRIAMADLRSLFEDLGYAHVKTLLNSGNVVFAGASALPAAAAAGIEAAVAKRLGVRVSVILVSAEEIAALVKTNPLEKRARDPSRLLVAFLGDPTGAEQMRLLADKAWGDDAIVVAGRSAWVWCANGVSRSPLWAALNREFRDTVTSRNWATVLKVHALLSAIG
jgi:uncharacterized protein (DUF1697 family)